MTHVPSFVSFPGLKHALRTQCYTLSHIIMKEFIDFCIYFRNDADIITSTVPFSIFNVIKTQTWYVNSPILMFIQHIYHPKLY